MPSPFPGMDPYLEGPRLWPDVHHSLISGIRQQLNPQLRPKYVARIEERVYISDETDLGRRAIVPDIHVTAPNRTQSVEWRGSLASAEPVASAITVIELIEQEIREPRIEILDLDRRTVVTVIEVLSPTNKLRGSEGRREYLKKRRSVLASTTHLVEIDLLREGAPVFAGQDLPAHDYGIYVSRALADDRQGLYWPILLSQRLPEVAIPLNSGDPDVRLDLQSVLQEQYDDAGYEMDIDYSSDPDVSLVPGAVEWVNELLSAKRLR
jgi:hypothetical protein